VFRALPPLAAHKGWESPGKDEAALSLLEHWESVMGASPEPPGLVSGEPPLASAQPPPEESVEAQKQTLPILVAFYQQQPHFFRGVWGGEGDRVFAEAGGDR
jgi:hypothetical protein